MQKRTTLLAGIALVLLAGIFACVIALLIIPGVQLLPLYRIEPEDILPAKETVLLMRSPSSQDLDRYKKTFPALDDVISDVALDAVAVVKSDAATQSIGFIRKSAAWDGTSCEVGSYRIVRSDAFPCPAIAELDQFLFPGPRLSGDRGWRALGTLPKVAWIFLKRESLPQGATVAERITEAAMLGDATHVLLSNDEGMQVVRAWPVEPLPSLDRSALGAPIHTSDMAFAFGDAEALWDGLMQSTSDNDGVVLQGIALQHLMDLAGPNVSLRHDLLPLVRYQSELYTGKTSSGALSVLLAGSAEQGLNLDDRLEALHRSFALRHPDTELLRFAFDDGRFPFATLRLAEEGDAEEEQIRGWSVRISRDASDSAMLITARSDRQIALSNDPDALRRFLMEEGEEIPLPSGTKTLLGKTVTGMLVPNAWLKAFGMPETGKNIVSIEQNGQTRTVRVKGMAN